MAAVEAELDVEEVELVGVLTHPVGLQHAWRPPAPLSRLTLVGEALDQIAGRGADVAHVGMVGRDGCDADRQLV
jgi:hypothetical protein